MPETLEGTEILESLDAFQDTWPLAAGDTQKRYSTDLMPKKKRWKNTVSWEAHEDRGGQARLPRHLTMPTSGTSVQ